MSAHHDTTPTAEDLAAARAQVTTLTRRYGDRSGAELSLRVAIALGVIVANLKATNAVDARLTAEARALYAAWMEA
jgi:hypothetical protein